MPSSTLVRRLAPSAAFAGPYVALSCLMATLTHPVAALARHLIPQRRCSVPLHVLPRLLLPSRAPSPPSCAPAPPSRAILRPPPPDRVPKPPSRVPSHGPAPFARRLAPTGALAGPTAPLIAPHDCPHAPHGRPHAPDHLCSRHQAAWSSRAAQSHLCHRPHLLMFSSPAHLRASHGRLNFALDGDWLVAELTNHRIHVFNARTALLVHGAARAHAHRA
ncbi:hypothetical protein DENSPDRAFT_887236 [Dentipellis sp. KUC8613]|nr:hypothetical protein DENSPDRAFT_887236 [Dentipellis sp. KUC8613]